MKNTFQRYQFILLGLVIGVFLMCADYIFQKPRLYNWIVYEVNTTQQTLPAFMLKDTFFTQNEVIVRSFKTSYTDTFSNTDIRRKELKINFSAEVSQDSIDRFINHLVDPTEIKIVNSQIFLEKARYKLFAWLLFGLVIGYLLKFRIERAKNK